MNDVIDTSSDLRDQITVDYREVIDDEERFESPTMEDYTGE